jgi:hypothetical protein
MAKIHTHYDNLKVSRHAPQEVIRAAYKALSQKYHPDKNPGDERAARIMAIVNTAYNILSDPVRRKEHDDWIASEEWEVEWLESTRGDEGRDKARGEQHWEPRQVDAPSRWRVLRDPRWWGLMLAAFAGGGALTLVLLDPPKFLPSALAWSGRTPSAATVAATAPAATPASASAAASVSASASASASAQGTPPEPLGGDASADGWARPAGQADAPPDIKALAVTQLIVPARAPDCDTDLQAQVAPTGDPWPAQSGYIDGYPLGNQGDEMQVLVDNSNNPSPVLVKIYDLDRRSNVRHAYVLGRAKFLIDKLSAGKYEVRYQNIMIGGARPECVNGQHAPLRQAAARQPGA